MSPLLRALSAERMKLRDTLALRMSVIAPGVVVALFVLQVAVMKHSTRAPVDPFKAWTGFSENVMTLWSLLMLPLFITLESALLAGVEHADRHWKHLLALPVPRRVHYLAKLIALAGMVLVATMLLALLIGAGGMLLGRVQPGFGLAGSPPWAFLAAKSAEMFAASLLMVAIQNWVSIRWSSFTIAVSFGMTATVVGMMVVQSKQFGHWYPWSMPTMAFAGGGAHAPFVALAGVVGGAIVATIGLIDFQRREFS